MRKVHLPNAEGRCTPRGMSLAAEIAGSCKGSEEIWSLQQPWVSCLAGRSRWLNWLNCSGHNVQEAISRSRAQLPDGV